MKLYFYRGQHENFGDELNHWLMPKVFPEFFDDDPSVLFLGIGSIILDTHPKDVQARTRVWNLTPGGWFR